MTTKTFNESVNAEIRRMTNKAKWEIELEQKRYDDSKLRERLDAATGDVFNTPQELINKAQQGEPTSFSAWLEANGDSIEPLDRTEATAKWFDEKAEHENDLRQESIWDFETWEIEQGEL